MSEEGKLCTRPFISLGDEHTCKRGDRVMGCKICERLARTIATQDLTPQRMVLTLSNFYRHFRARHPEEPVDDDFLHFLKDEQYIVWIIKGRRVKFKVVRFVKNLPARCKRIKSALFDDHIEELYWDGKNYYRASGGYGLYWIQLLKEVKR